MERTAEIYYARTAMLADGGTFEEMLSLVNERRRAKVLCCRREEDRLRSLAAGLLVRYGLEQRGVDYEAAGFGVDRLGKPCLLSRPDIRFNVSHSGSYAACAFSRQEIGVDMERVSGRFSGEKGKKRMERVADRCFSAEEKSYVLRLDGRERADAFVMLWTRKECCAKACGEGIRMDFSGIDALREEYFFSRRVGDCWLSVCMGAESPRKMEEAAVALEEVDLKTLAAKGKK